MLREERHPRCRPIGLVPFSLSQAQPRGRSGVTQILRENRRPEGLPNPTSGQLAQPTINMEPGYASRFCSLKLGNAVWPRARVNASRL